VDFDAVYERFRGPVWRLARRLTGDDEEALDTTQEIFVRVWRGLPKFRGEAKLSTWVFQIAWNHLRAHRRRMGRHGMVMVADVEGRELAIESARDPRADPERAASASELAGRVAAALQELPEHYRVVVWLRDGEDLSYEEIAAVLDIPIGTVRSRLARARSILKQAVES
jgi:RNA polymerase sigma-70 factor (ECF subfamily)